MKNFKQKDLEKLCRQQIWQFEGPYEKTEDVLEKRVTILEDKMLGIIEKVAQRKTQMANRRHYRKGEGEAKMEKDSKSVKKRGG